MKINSIQLRAALLLSVVVVLVWLAAAAAAVRLLTDEMNEVFDSALQETGQRLLQLAVIDILGRDEAGVSQRVTALDDHDEYYTYLVRDDLGRVLLASHSADPAQFPSQPGESFFRTDTHRIYQESAVSGTITLAIAEPLSHRDQVAREATVVLALPLVLMIPLMLVGIVFALRFGLRPLGQLQMQVAMRDENDLSPLPTDDLPTELRPITKAMNQLFQRLTGAFQAERSFASNAAHELRTPLAGALAQLQRLQQETKDPATIRRADDIEVTLKRMARLSERLIDLARAEGARLRADQVSDLRPILRFVVQDAQRSEDGSRVTLTLPETPVLSDLDADALAILARNLIENALRHGSGGPVTVSLSRTGGFCVENDCPAVSQDTLSTLSTRFARAPSAGEGSGLGLSIVATIADRIGGRFELISPLPGTARGFRACVRLPIASLSETVQQLGHPS
ncbi:MAG: ATP-binding protein [Paracoccaceae bacterium]